MEKKYFDISNCNSETVVKINGSFSEIVLMLHHAMKSNKEVYALMLVSTQLTMLEWNTDLDTETEKLYAERGLV